MGQQNSRSYLLSIVITALVVGGGIYWWQTMQPSPPKINNEMAQSKTLDEYLNSYEKSPTTLSEAKLNTLVTVFSLDISKPCTTPQDELCDPKTNKNPASLNLLSDQKWFEGGVHEFYFRFGVGNPVDIILLEYALLEGGAGALNYYGPFHDNVLGLAQEATKKKNFTR